MHIEIEGLASDGAGAELDGEGLAPVVGATGVDHRWGPIAAGADRRWGRSLLGPIAAGADRRWG